MTNGFNRQGFTQALNELKQLPRTEWMDFVKNKYQKAQDGTYEQKLNQAKQMINNHNPFIQQFANQMGQYGIKF